MKKTLDSLLLSRGVVLAGPVVAGLALAAIASASDVRVDGTKLNGGVPSANQNVGTPDTIVPASFSLSLVAEGIDLLENPSGRRHASDS